MIALILVAAGSSSRLGIGKKKEYLPFPKESEKGGTVLSASAKAFLKTLPFDIVCVTYPFSEDFDSEEKEKSQNAFFSDPELSNIIEENHTKVIFTAGGTSRQESVLKALKVLSMLNLHISECFIHDAARPFIKSSVILECFEAAKKFGGAAPGLTPTDTQKEIDSEGFLTRHLVRKNLVSIQTPQVFDFEKILKAHEIASTKNFEFTDDTEIFDLFAESQFKTKIVSGDIENRKITYKTDLDFMKEKSMNIRTGLGYDKHLLVEGRKLVLGGVEFEFEKGEAGHSDGDVLLHAVTDAVLGASCLGDIGSYFPPSDPKWKDADSKMLLRKVWEDVKSAGYRIGNLDCVIQIEKPKFLPKRDEVRKSIAQILDCNMDQVFVKAKTGEKTGEIGTSQSVEAYATVLLLKD